MKSFTDIYWYGSNHISTVLIFTDFYRYWYLQISTDIVNISNISTTGLVNDFQNDDRPAIDDQFWRYRHEGKTRCHLQCPKTTNAPFSNHIYNSTDVYIFKKYFWCRSWIRNYPELPWCGFGVIYMYFRIFTIYDPKMGIFTSIFDIFNLCFRHK